MTLLKFDVKGELLLFTVHKRCYECGTEWDSRCFTEQPAGATLPGCCEPCIRKSEERVATLTTRAVYEPPVPQLKFPTRPPDSDD